MAQEAKEATTQDVEPLDLDSLRSRIKSSLSARRALASIVRDGCNETSLLNNLLPYFQPATEMRKLEEKLERKKKANQNFTTRVRKLGERLEYDAKDIERILEELGSDEEMIKGTYIGINVYGFWQLPDKMNSLGTWLLSLSRGLQNGDLSETDRMRSVIYVCCLVKAATGKKHFKDIATIIAAGTGNESINIHKLADNIRNQINRDRKSDIKFRVQRKGKSKGKRELAKGSGYHLMCAVADEEVSEWTTHPGANQPTKDADPPKEMNFVVIGTDHRMQQSEASFEAILRSWLVRSYFEPLTAIAEEYSETLGESIGQRLAKERHLRWYSLDMTTEEKSDAGILEEQYSRPPSQAGVTFRVPSDDIREMAWIEKLVQSASGTTIVICGYLHLEPVVKMLRAKGHTVDQRIYLESVPEIRLPTK